MLIQGVRQLVGRRAVSRLLFSRYLRPTAACCSQRLLSSDADKVPPDAKVVICGGGVVGTSVAYHLAEHGWKDIVLFEQGSLSCGTTWHAAGLLGSLKSSNTEIEMALYGQRFYKGLEAEGIGTGWKECGSLFLARTVDRLILYKRQLITAQRFGVEGVVLSPREIADRYPQLHTDDLVGGVHIPNDGVVNPTDVTMAMAKKAKEKGVHIMENTQVKRVLTRNNKVHGVETDKGLIECQYFVNCAGMWARELGQQSEPRVRVPLHPCEHFYIVTKPIEGIDRMFPVVRDYDGYVYIREWSGGLLGGGFEPKAKPVFHKGIPDKFQFQLLPEDWDHFHIMLDQLLHRIPALEHAEVRQLVNGAESFTPDGKFIIGEAPEVDNYYLVAGMNGHGITLGPGVGFCLSQFMTKRDPDINPFMYDVRRFTPLHNNRTFLKARVAEAVGAGMNSLGITMGPGIGRHISDWIVNGEASTNLWSYDVRRFVDMHNNNKFLRDRVSETLGCVAKIPFWDTQTVDLTTGRKLRTSPLYTRMEKDAVFGQTMAYERPLYFMSSKEGFEDGTVKQAKPADPAAQGFRSGRKLCTSALYPREEAAGAQFIQNARGHERSAWFIPIPDENSLEVEGIHSKADPQLEFKSCRKVCTSILYPREEEAGGKFVLTPQGFERAAWFNPPADERLDPDAYLDTEMPSQGSFGRPVWFDRVKSEYWACREGVCLIDMSTFTKFELRSAGSEVTDFLQTVCSNDIDKPIGMVIHTGMQNHHGGYENDCSIVRLADNHYFMIGPTAQQTRAYAWLRDHLPQDGSVQLTDVTSMYTAINVIGPKAQELLSELTDTSLNKQDFFSMTCKVIDVGQASGVKAMRLTHSGEDGWCLYIPSEYALHVYDSLMSVGKDFGVRNAGYYALRALRTEKFFAYWGTDLTPHTTPMECGREYRVKFDVGNFIGHGALLQQKNNGIKKRLVQLLLENHSVDSDPWPWGGEPVYRNGKFVGTATSTAYGFTLDRQVVLAYVSDIDETTGEARYITTDFILKNARYEVDIAGERFPAKVNMYPPTLAPAAIVIDTPQAKVAS